MTAIVRGDARQIPLASSSVDLIVTSPPYFGLRDYDDDRQIGSEPAPAEFLEALWSVMHECWRVLKPSGSCFVNLGDKRAGSGAPGTTTGLNGMTPRSGDKAGRSERVLKVQGERSGRRAYQHDRSLEFGRAKSKMMLPARFAIGCMDGEADPDGIGWIVRQDLVWDKPNGMPESALDRTHDKHEAWYHLTKTGSYYAALDEIREPHVQPLTADEMQRRLNSSKNSVRHDRNIGAARGGDQMDVANASESNPLGKIPSSVWRIPTEPLTIPEWLDVTEHYAAFPSEWPRRLILAFSPSEGVVLDPFGGTGTTAMVARALGRTGISLDLSYNRLARWRIFESDGAAKVADRTARGRQGTLL